MNLPNKLTVMRIILIPVFIVLFFVPFDWHMLAAMIVFCVASFTDFLDGYIARKKHLVTDLGKFLDPIADKMLVSCALIAVCISGFIAPAVPDGEAFAITVAVCVMVIIARELMVSGFRIVAAGKGTVLAADMTGKAKTVCQMVSLILLLPVPEYCAVNALAGQIVYYIGFGLLGVATVLTIVSAVHYLVKNKSVLEG